ncbi:DUF5980 family protein [Actinosynnema sp. NPDC059797]
MGCASSTAPRGGPTSPTSSSRSSGAGPPTSTSGCATCPPGWTATQSRIPPGSNHPDPDDGSVRVNGFTLVQGSATVPLATYRAQIWVSDGTVTDTHPADIVVTTASWVDCMQGQA